MMLTLTVPPPVVEVVLQRLWQLQVQQRLRQALLLHPLTPPAKVMEVGAMEEVVEVTEAMEVMEETMEVTEEAMEVMEVEMEVEATEVEMEGKEAMGVGGREVKAEGGEEEAIAATSFLATTCISGEDHNHLIGPCTMDAPGFGALRSFCLF